MIQTLRKYAVTLDDSTAGSRKISFLPYKAGTNTFATSSDWTLGAGDFKVAKAVAGSGLGAEASIATAPTWVNGRVVIILSGTELTCRYLTIRIEHAAINSEEIVVETFGHASAQYPTVYSGGSAGNVLSSGTGTDQIAVSGSGQVDAGKINGSGAAASALGSYWANVIASTVTTGGDVNNFVVPLIPRRVINWVCFFTSGTAAGRAGVVEAQNNGSDTALILDNSLDVIIGNGDGFLLLPQMASLHDFDGLDLDSSGVTSLLSRLTLTRAGYLDKLNITGNVASQADVLAINQSASRRVILTTVAQYERPESGTSSYTVEARLYDPDGAATNGTGTPTLTAAGIVSGDLSANLSAATNPSIGVYRWTYSVASAAAIEQIRFDVATTQADGSFPLSVYTQVADFVAATFTTADRTTLNAAAADASTAATQAAGANTAIGTANTALTAIKGTGWVASDNLHQIRSDIANVSGGGGGGFTGASAVTLTFHDADGAAVPNVVFTIAGVGTGATDATGIITIGLNDGDYTVRTGAVAGTLFADTALTVAGATALTITGTADVIPPPTTPGLVAGYCDLFDTLGAPAAGGQIEIQRTDTTGAAGTSALRESTFADADDTGRVTVNVEAGKTFRARREGGPWVAFTAPASGSFALPHVLGQAGGN